MIVVVVVVVTSIERSEALKAPALTCAPGTVGLPPLWSDIIGVSVIMMTARKVTYPFTLATRHTGVARTYM